MSYKIVLKSIDSVDEFNYNNSINFNDGIF